jgi:uncharacterized protein YcfL
MNKNLLALSLLLLMLTSCSSNNNTEETSTDIAVESEEAVLEENSSASNEEFVEESSSDSASEEEVMVETESTAPSVATDETTEMELDEEKVDSVNAEPELSATSDVSTEATEVIETKTSEDAKFAYYQVQKGDSLMLVSFKVYGDYRKWKTIYHLNESSLKNNTALSAGMNLKYQVSEEKFSWNPVGNPYLIKTDDTLGKISNEVYKKPLYWKYIYDNNRPLIRNPNLIFAGFTLYYKELTEEVINNYRSLSSKKK